MMQRKKFAAKGMSSSIKVMLTGGILVLVLLVAIIFTLKGNQPPVYTIKDGEFEISTEYGENIRLSDIQKIELKKDLPANLFRTNGYGFGNIIRGKCSSSIGNIIVYLDTSLTSYIYLTTGSGIVILNNQTTEKTLTLYQELSAAATQANGSMER